MLIHRSLFVWILFFVSIFVVGGRLEAGGWRVGKSTEIAKLSQASDLTSSANSISTNGAEASHSGLRPQKTSGLSIDSVHVGIRGYYKLGLWTPIFVSWSGTAADQVEEIEFHSVDSDGTPVCTKLGIGDGGLGIGGDSDSKLSPISHHAIIYAKIGRANQGITIKLCGKTGNTVPGSYSPSPIPHPQSPILAEKRIQPENVELRGTSRKAEQMRQDHPFVFLSPVPQERPIILILGENDGGIQDAIGLLRLKDNRRPVLVQIDSLDQLPEDSLGLEMVEHVFLTTSVPALWEGTTSKDVRITALYEWLKWGGKMLFAPGKASEPFLSNANAPLTQFLPGRFERMAVLRQGKPIELYANSTRSILMDGSEAAPFIALPFLAEPQGTLELAEADLPLIVRNLVGFGTLTYFGGDLTSEPLSDWRDRDQLLLKLLNWTESKSKAATSHSLIHLGFHDMSGQIRSALDQFDGVRTIPFSLILVLIGVYVFLIGPGDWFLVHKILKRPYLTWITFPFWIILFCWISLFLGASNRTQPLTVNTVELIDLQPSEQMLRSSTWCGVFSPQDAKYDVLLRREAGGMRHETGAAAPLTNTASNENVEQSKIDDSTNTVESPIHPLQPPASSLQPQSHLHWLGLSGSGLGGMEPKTVELNTWYDSYEYRERREAGGGRPEESPELQSVPMRVRSTKSFFGQTTIQSPIPHPPSPISHSLRYVNGVLVGSITNNLPVPLEHGFLVYGPWTLRLDRLEPGQVLEIGPETMRRELRMLANSSATGISDEGAFAGRQTSFYSSESKDVWPILRTMTFFQAFGGVESIGLHNSLHSNLDWSSVLTTDHAVFVATVPADAEFCVDQLVVQPSRTDAAQQTDSQTQTLKRHTTVIRAVFPFER